MKYFTGSRLIRPHQQFISPPEETHGHQRQYLTLDDFFFVFPNMLTHPQLQTFVCLFFNLLFFCDVAQWVQFGDRKLFKALQRSDGFDGYVLVFCFYHVSIMCPQNSRKGSCDHVMDFTDRCHLSRPWGENLHRQQPSVAVPVASAVNTFLACRDAET